MKNVTKFTAAVAVGVAAIVSVAVGVVPASAATAPVAVTVKADFGANYTTKPSSINPGYADGGIAFKGLHWTYWGKDHARATGTEYRKTCVPNCATGPITHKAVTVYLDGVVKGHFTKLVSSDGVHRDLVK